AWNALKPIPCREGAMRDAECDQSLEAWFDRALLGRTDPWPDANPTCGDSLPEEECRRRLAAFHNRADAKGHVEWSDKDFTDLKFATAWRPGSYTKHHSKYAPGWYASDYLSPVSDEIDIVLPGASGDCELVFDEAVVRKAPCGRTITVAIP